MGIYTMKTQAFIGLGMALLECSSKTTMETSGRYWAAEMAGNWLLHVLWQRFMIFRNQPCIIYKHITTHKLGLLAWLSALRNIDCYREIVLYCNSELNDAHKWLRLVICDSFTHYPHRPTVHCPQACSVVTNHASCSNCLLIALFSVGLLFEVKGNSFHAASQLQRILQWKLSMEQEVTTAPKQMVPHSVSGAESVRQTVGQGCPFQWIGLHMSLLSDDSAPWCSSFPFTLFFLCLQFRPFATMTSAILCSLPSSFYRCG